VSLTSTAGDDAIAEPPPRRPPLYRSLFFQLLVAIVAGILVGWLAPGFGANLKPVADTFINLIKMCIAPIIFFTVVLGIAHVGDLKSVGRIGLKALIYFEVVTTFALLFGLVVGNVVQPGSGFDIDPATLATGAEAVAAKTNNGELPATVQFLMSIVPASVLQAFRDEQPVCRCCSSRCSSASRWRGCARPPPSPSCRG